MGQKFLLLAVERAQIVALHIETLSERQIPKRLQCSKSSIHRVIEKFKKHEIYGDMKKTGSSHKTSQRDGRAIRQALMQFPTSSCREIRAKLLENGTKISISTVSRRLSKKSGLKFYKSAVEPRLTSARKQKRDYVLPINVFIGLGENWKQFSFQTNLQFSSLQCKRGTFEDKNF